MSTPVGTIDLATLDTYVEGTLQVVVETPRGSRNKYAWDARRRCFQLKKLLPAGMGFPYDFGFVPSTRGGDDAELDALVLIDEPAFPGCVVAVRPVGVLIAEDHLPDGTVRRNDRLITVGTHSMEFANTRDVNDLPEKLLQQIRQFFEGYARVLGDKEHRVLAIENRPAAEKLIQESLLKETVAM